MNDSLSKLFVTEWVSEIIFSDGSMDGDQQHLLLQASLFDHPSHSSAFTSNPSQTVAMNNLPPKMPSTSSLNYKIYPPSIEDAEEIEAFCVEVFPATYEHAWYEYMLQTDTVYKLCYRKDGKIVALIVGQVAKREAWNDVLQVAMNFDMENNKRLVTAYIMLLGVAPEHRRFGLGTRSLLSFMTMIKLAFPTVSRSFFLHCAVENTAALVMYERQGFRSVRVLKNYYNYNRIETPADYHDAWLLSKKITPASEIFDTLREGLSLCFYSSVNVLKKVLTRLVFPAKFVLRCVRDVFSSGFRSDQINTVGSKTQPTKVV